MINQLGNPTWEGTRAPAPTHAPKAARRCPHAAGGPTARGMSNWFIVIG